MTQAPDLSAFPGLTPLHPLPGGHRHAVWLAQSPNGQFVAKSTTRSDAALRWLEAPQAMARAAGLIVPGLIAAADGRLAPNGWTLEPLLDGRAAQPVNMAALLPKLQAFHRAATHLPQRPGFASTRDLQSQSAGGDVDLDRLPPDLAAACRAAWRVLTGVETTLHGDVTPANVILTADGPALIDWDESRRDLPVFDTIACRPASALQRRAHLAWEVAARWAREPDHARALAQSLLAP